MDSSFVKRTALSFATALSGLGLGGLGASAAIVPIAAYRFEETSYAEAVVDESGNQLNGFNTGSIFTNVPGPPGFGSASNFDNGWVELGRPTQLTQLLSNFTVTAWINPITTEGYRRIFASNYGSGWGWGLNNGQLRFTTFGIQDYDVPLSISIGNWNHVAVTFDAAYDATFYLNGEALGTVSGSSSAAPSQYPFMIGSNGSENFLGWIDEVGVFQGVLTPEEIARVMDEGVLATDTPQVPGDANGDGCATGADFTIWADNFDDGTGVGGKTWREGDWTGEGYVTGADFTIWSDNFGCPPTAVPEPASAGLACGAAFALLLVRGRRINRSNQ